jgi:hypothetical protein
MPVIEKPRSSFDVSAGWLVGWLIGCSYVGWSMLVGSGSLVVRCWLVGLLVGRCWLIGWLADAGRLMLVVSCSLVGKSFSWLVGAY